MSTKTGEVHYGRPGSRSLGSYDKFIIDPARARINDKNLSNLKPKNLKKLQDFLTDALATELAVAGYDIVTVADGQTMRISTTIAGFKASKVGGALNVGTMVAGMVTGIPVLFAVSVGDLTIEAEFIEAVSGVTEGVILLRQQGNRVFNPSPWSTWSDVKRSMTEFAELFAQAVDDAHGK